MSKSIWTETTRRCKTCHEFKEFCEYHKDKGAKNGITGMCKDCSKVHTKIMRKKHKEKRAIYSKKYNEENKEKIKTRRAIYSKKYNEENKEKIKARRSVKVNCPYCDKEMSASSLKVHTSKWCVALREPSEYVYDWDNAVVVVN